MKILIGHIGTKLFVQDKDRWTSDRQAAKKFMQSSEAIKYINRHGLKGVEIVLSFPNEGYDIRLSSADAHSKNSGYSAHTSAAD